MRLPGLDVKRFPDITYVPIQFPERDIAIGDTWEFAKKFGESDVSYSCKLSEQKGDLSIINVTIKQEYELLEDSALEVVVAEKDAEHRVKTVMTGSGIVLFDTKRGNVVKAEMVNDAVSDVTKLSSGAKSKRVLRTTFSLALKEPTAVRSQIHSGSWIANAWASVVSGTQRLIESTLGWWTVAKLAFQSQVTKKSVHGG